MSKFRKKSFSYTDAFKNQVVDRVMSCEMSVSEASKHYGIGGSMTIYRWLNKYAPQWREIPVVARETMTKEEKKAPESAGELGAELLALKRLLEAERIRSEAFLTMIKLAEEKYGILIEKKSGAKQSK